MQSQHSKSAEVQIVDLLGEDWKEKVPQVYLEGAAANYNEDQLRKLKLCHLLSP